MIHRKVRTNEIKQEFLILMDKLIDQLDSYYPMKEISTRFQRTQSSKWTEMVMHVQIVSQGRQKFSQLPVIGKG